MPMKWTPENDQLLLLKILETHDLSVDTKKVAEAWPATAGQDRPTPRAITERLVRMRQIVKSTGNSDGHFSIGKGNPTNGSPSATSTSRRARKVNALPTTPGSGRHNRTPKTSIGNPGPPSDLEGENLSSSPAVKMEIEDPNNATPTQTPTKRPLHPTHGGMNQSSMSIPMGITLKSPDGGPVVGEVTPTKRTRRASTLAPGMVSYTFEEERADDVESSASEYMPDDAVKMGDADADYA